MYTTRSGLILAFHGCDESLIPDLLSGKKSLVHSENSYDWLGHGSYFWDNNPRRALEFATFLTTLKGNKKNTVHKPAVIGAVINLGFCLDLLDSDNLIFLEEAYLLLEASYKALGLSLPVNKPIGGNKDLILRELDCAVIESLHQFREQENMKPFDSVRGVFWEGTELYPNAGFRKKDHIQICIRNPNCIKGYFLPRQQNNKFSLV